MTLSDKELQVLIKHLREIITDNSPIYVKAIVQLADEVDVLKSDIDALELESLEMNT